MITNRRVLDVLYPRVCVSCGEPIAEEDAQGLCWDCRSSSLPIHPPWCDVCGVAVAGRIDHAFVCADCEEDAPVYQHARSLYRYEGGVREAIHALKYRKEFSVVPDLSHLLWAGLQAHLDVDTVLTPVPLHWRRRMERGFNQSEELIRGMRKQGCPLPVWKGLRRVKRTDTQTQLSKAGRKANVRNAFQVKGGKVPSRVLLIDDVMTTGATLNAAARALQKAGVSQIQALTIARG